MKKSARDRWNDGQAYILGAVALFATLLIGATPAKKQAGALVDRGHAAVNDARYQGAISPHRSAVELYPSPRILVNLAEAQLELGQWGPALANFQKFIEDGGARPGSPIHQSVAARIEEIREKLGRVLISGAAREVELRIDDVPTSFDE